MDMIWQATLDGYVKLLYDNDPQGPLLESIRDFEKRFCQVAEENRGTVRALGIRQAPTLVSGGQKWTGVSGVREFIAAKENANV